MKPISAMTCPPAVLHGASSTARLAAETCFQAISCADSSPIESFRRLVRPGISFTVGSCEQPCDVNIAPVCDDEMARALARARSMLGFWHRVAHRERAWAEAAIGASRCSVSLAQHMVDRLLMQLWQTGEDMYDASVCEFSYDLSALHIYNTVTRENLRQRWLNTILQRLSYLLAKRPPRIVIHEIVNTNPLWDSLARAYRNEDSHPALAGKAVIASIERRFDARVTGMHYYISGDTGLRRTRDCKAAVDPLRSFTLEVAVATDGGR